VVLIGAFDRLIDSSNKNFEEAKKGLEELYEYGILFEELDNNFLNAENFMHINNDIFIKTTLLISEIKEKQEITNRLNSLSYNVGWLKSAIIIKDSNIISKSIKNVMNNEYSSINAIISELNSLKSSIDKLKRLHSNLLDSNILGLDIQILLEQDFKRNYEKLYGLYNKQKDILLNLSSIFINLTRDSVLKNKN